MITLAKAVVKQMSAHKLANNRVINNIGLGVGLYRRFHITQARYFKITNAELIVLTSMLRENPFTKICHPGSGKTNPARPMHAM